MAQPVVAAAATIAAPDDEEAILKRIGVKISTDLDGCHSTKCKRHPHWAGKRPILTQCPDCPDSGVDHFGQTATLVEWFPTRAGSRAGCSRQLTIRTINHPAPTLVFPERFGTPSTNNVYLTWDTDSVLAKGKGEECIWAEFVPTTPLDEVYATLKKHHAKLNTKKDNATCPEFEAIGLRDPTGDVHPLSLGVPLTGFYQIVTRVCRLVVQADNALQQVYDMFDNNFRLACNKRAALLQALKSRMLGAKGFCRVTVDAVAKLIDTATMYQFGDGHSKVAEGIPAVTIMTDKLVRTCVILRAICRACDDTASMLVIFDPAKKQPFVTPGGFVIMTGNAPGQEPTDQVVTFVPADEVLWNGQLLVPTSRKPQFNNWVLWS